MKLPTTIALLAPLALALCRLSFGQTAPSTQPTEPTIVRMTLHPMAISQPALQYKLLPPMTDTHPGDAAYKYQLADQWLSHSDFDHDGKKADRLLDADRSAFPIADAEAFMANIGGTRWIDDGARCEGAHWDTDFRSSGINTLLPYLNSIRAEANVVAIEGRLAIAKGDYTRAERCIQTNLSLAHQLNSDPFEVQALVGAGIVRLALDKNIEDWIAREKSPNLFWPLANLPNPFMDPAAVARVERAMVAFTDPPYLAQALNGTLPADQWQQVIRFMVHLQLAFKSNSSEVNKNAEPQVDQDTTALIATEAAPSRKYLVSNGMAATEVAAMPDAKAVGVCWIQQYKIASDDQWKGWSLPYPQAESVLTTAQNSLNASGQADHNLFLKILVPLRTPIKARLTLARADRQIALLEVIEALRDYGARHDGSLPDSLDQITDLPIPPDPVSGKAFNYHRDGQVVTIDALTTKELSNLWDGRYGLRRYELTFSSP